MTILCATTPRGGQPLRWWHVWATAPDYDDYDEDTEDYSGSTKKMDYENLAHRRCHTLETKAAPSIVQEP